MARGTQRPGDRCAVSRCWSIARRRRGDGTALGFGRTFRGVSVRVSVNAGIGRFRCLESVFTSKRNVGSNPTPSVCPAWRYPVRRGVRCLTVRCWVASYLRDGRPRAPAFSARRRPRAERDAASRARNGFDASRRESRPIPDVPDLVPTRNTRRYRPGCRRGSSLGENSGLVKPVHADPYHERIARRNRRGLAPPLTLLHACLPSAHRAAWCLHTTRPRMR